MQHQRRETIKIRDRGIHHSRSRGTRTAQRAHLYCTTLETDTKPTPSPVARTLYTRDPSSIPARPSHRVPHLARCSAFHPSPSFPSQRTDSESPRILPPRSGLTLIRMFKHAFKHLGPGTVRLHSMWTRRLRLRTSSHPLVSFGSLLSWGTHLAGRRRGRTDHGKAKAPPLWLLGRSCRSHHEHRQSLQAPRRRGT